MDTVHECDRRTDGQTELRSRIVSHSKNTNALGLHMISLSPVSVTMIYFNVVKTEQLETKTRDQD